MASERGARQLRVAGRFPVNHMQKGGRVIQIRMALKKAGSSVRSAWGWACVCKSILACSSGNKEEASLFKLHLWTGKRLPVTTGSP